jgi:predicted glutamine amidotransferase
MCRFLAYQGEPILMEQLVATPCYSLIHQSLHAAEAPCSTNGDGFGLGWYGERPGPGIYREVRPAWSDENLRAICAQVRSGQFFAHVRSSTGGTNTSRTNCHPFGAGRHMFMHNGQIAEWARVRRAVENLIPDELYGTRVGSTDSEALFLAAFAHGLTEDPVNAFREMLRVVKRAMLQAGVSDPLHFTATLSDGDTLWAFRWSCDDAPASLYFKETETGVTLVSEPIDDNRAGWLEVPRQGTLIARGGKVVSLDVEDEGLRAAA